MSKGCVILISDWETVNQWTNLRITRGYGDDNDFAKHLLQLELNCTNSLNSQIEIEDIGDELENDIAEFDELCQRLPTDSRRTLQAVFPKGPPDQISIEIVVEPEFDLKNASDPDSPLVLPNDDCSVLEVISANARSKRGRKRTTGPRTKPIEQPDDAVKQELLRMDHRSKDAIKKLQIAKRKVLKLTKTFECDICPKTFVSEVVLVKHKERHDNIKKYSCDICGDILSTASSLSRHKQMHNKEKKNKCDICGKTFLRHYYLETHKRTHTGIKPYQCEQCGRSFIVKQKLKRHLPCNPKKHICTLCGKAYAVKFNLNEHMNWHKGIKKYVCRFCGKRCMYDKEIRTHEATHFTKDGKFIEVVGSIVFQGE